MKESRRSVIGKIGGLSIVSTGFTGGVAATRGPTRPSDVHPDDKVVLTRDELRDHPEVRRYFRKSPIFKRRAKGSDEILFYMDYRAARREIDHAELSTSGDVSVSKQLTNTSEWEKLQRKARKQKKEMDQEVQTSIERNSKLANSQSSEVGTLGHNGDIVTTGTDTTLYSNDYADSGKAGLWGNKDSSADTSNDHIYTEIAQAPSYGNAWAWAYLADEFEVAGSSQEFCNVSSSVYYDGYLFSAAGGTSEITITFKLKNLSSGNTYTKTHLDESYTDLTGTNYLEATDSEAEVVQLTPGDHYRATVRAEAHTSIVTNQGAIVDFGNMQDGSEYVDAQYYDFDFS